MYRVSHDTFWWAGLQAALAAPALRQRQWSRTGSPVGSPTLAGKRLGTRPAVGLGGTPALLQLERGSLPDVELTAHGVSARHMTGLGIEAHLRKVRRSGKGSVVDSSTVTVDVNSASLAGAGASRPNSVVVPGPVNGRLVVHLGHGHAGALAVPVSPVLDGRTIRVTTGRPTFTGSPLPDALTKKITAKVARAVALSGGPAAFRA
ncbi:LmeA family phospholipid-binding protein [Streptomyces carpinensis]|uniref:LmeA family phospholipid-binding protein n=1 Tax=Streptomyces carpinensis TaxID=66369 RepID=A0ABV1W9N9_9ACTN|nr:LmeA family phospholipid-binding protein [Streptomyces carpinensis]